MADSELLIFNDDRLSRQLNDLYARMSESPAELAAFLVNPAGVVSRAFKVERGYWSNVISAGLMRTVSGPGHASITCSGRGPERG